MIRNNTKRNIAFFVGVIFYARNLRNVLHNILNCIDLKEVVNSLSDTGKSFKSHTCINIGMSKRSVIVVTVVFKLSENEVPELDKSVALTADVTVGTAAAVFLSPVVVNLGTGAAGTCAVLPEVILLAEAYHMTLTNADFLCPDVVGLVVVKIDADIELFGIHFHYFGAEFPCPAYSVTLEIIAEREIAEHLEISSVTCSLADIFNIGSSDALLTSCNPRSRRSDLSREILFHR